MLSFCKWWYRTAIAVSKVVKAGRFGTTAWTAVIAAYVVPGFKLCGWTIAMKETTYVPYFCSRCCLQTDREVFEAFPACLREVNLIIKWGARASLNVDFWVPHQSRHINIETGLGFHFIRGVVESWVVNPREKYQKVTMTSNCSMIMPHFEESLATDLLELLSQYLSGITGIERLMELKKPGPDFLSL